MQSEKKWKEKVQTIVKRALSFNPSTEAGPHEQLAEKKALERAAPEEGRWE